jgi:hypothetical protein
MQNMRAVIMLQRKAGAQRHFSKLSALEARHTPADNHRFEHAAGFVIAPLTVDVVAREWQLICPALVFTQNLDREAGRRHAGAIEFSQSSFARCHFLLPLFERHTHAASYALPLAQNCFQPFWR